MVQRLVGMFRLTVLVQAVLLSPVTQAQPQKADTPYPTRAPLDHYLMADQNSEIALARSAAPKAISDNAEVMVLDRQGYRTAIRGSNGFTCIVQRSWTAPFDDSEFWNPKLRSPMCLNEPGVRSYLPIIVERTTLVVAGKSNPEIAAPVSSPSNLDRATPVSGPPVLAVVPTSDVENTPTAEVNATLSTDTGPAGVEVPALDAPATTERKRVRQQPPRGRYAQQRHFWPFW